MFLLVVVAVFAAGGGVDKVGIVLLISIVEAVVLL